MKFSSRLPQISLRRPGAKWRAWKIGLMAPLLAFALLSPHVGHFAGHSDLDRRAWKIEPPFWRTLEAWELSLLDNRFSARGAVMPASRARLAIVAINDYSLDSLGQWPFPRRLHADLIGRLRGAGARVIGFDIGFDAHQGGALDPKTGAWTLSKDDRSLAEAIGKAGNVVLATHLKSGRTGAENGATYSATYSAPSPPIDAFDAQVADLGITFVPRDSDGSVRRYPFRYHEAVEKFPFGGFAPLCAALYQGQIGGNGNGDLKRYQKLLSQGQWPTLGAKNSQNPQSSLRSLPFQESVLPTGSDANGTNDEAPRVATTPLWFWGAPESVFPTYSYADVLDERRWSAARLRKAFAGRIVLVGATAPILKDVFPYPEFEDGAGGGSAREISGVEIHATMIAMLLDGQFLREQSGWGMQITLFLTCLGAGIWTNLLRRPVSLLARRASAAWARKKWPGRIHDAVWLGLYAGLGALAPLSFWWFARWELAARHEWIIAAYPLLGAALSYTGTLLLLFGGESAERRKTQTQMARIVAPDVMEEILAHPEAEYPRPRRVEASILFTDLDGFTAYASARQPEEVVGDLNALLTRIHPIVAAHGGSIDKYIGDSVMAFFGAPIPRADHAAQALACAIALQDECARFRLETGVPFWMRIGVHSGEVLVGSIGSKQHFNYTVIGDAVNIASRLESKNKEFGSRILCSAQTLDAAPGIARTRRAQTWIRGKSGTMEVFKVYGPQGQPPRGAAWGDHSDGIPNQDGLKADFDGEEVEFQTENTVTGQSVVSSLRPNSSDR